MHVRATAATAALLLAALTACGSDDGDPDEKSAAKKDSASKKVDCTDEYLSQAEWLENCAEGSGTGGDGTEGQATGLKFGEPYTWPDGIKVTVVEAQVFTDYDTELGESPTPGARDFRLKVKVTNGGKTPFDLGDLSTLVEGATTGGEARVAVLERGSDPLEGRLGAGVTVTKTDDNTLKTKYGRDIIVSVQRTSDDLGLDMEEPEFTGTIKG